MEESELVVALAVLTGYLEPADDATAADLHEARVRLARHLLANGIPAGLPPLEEPLPEALMEELRRIASEAADTIGAPTPGEVPVVVRRASDDLTQDIRWNGREVSRAFGPFADGADRRIWFEVFERAEFGRCVRGPGGAPLLLGNFGGASATEFTIARGSVWVRGNVLGRPAITWIGLRVASGTLRLDLPGTLSGGVLTIPIEAEGRLELALDAPPAPPPGAIGEDGRRARAGRPDTIAIRILRTGSGPVAIGQTSLGLYGSRLEFDATEAVCETDRDAAPAAYLVPLQVPNGELAPVDVRSTVLSIAGRAPVERAYWALPITMPANLSELGAAADIGDIVVVTGGGLELGWPGLPRAGYRAERVVAGVGTAMLSVRASRAPGRALAQRFHLWPGAAGGRSYVEARYDRPALLHHLSGVRAGAPRELTMVFGAGEAAVSPPVYADGESVTFAGRDLSVAFVRERDARFVAMRGGNDAGLGERVTLALANGLIGMTRPLELALTGSLATERDDADAAERALAIAPATVMMRAGVHGILPMLPDPYAASFDAPDFRRTERRGTVAIRVDWRPPVSPAVRLALGPVEGHAAQQLLPPGRSGEPDRALEALHRVYDELPLGPRLGPLVLLDVSSNADQLGVATAFPRRATNRPPPLAIEGLELCAQAHSLQILTVPTIQWETVWNEPNPLAAPFPAMLPSTGDGGPALIRSDSVRLVPIAPLPLSTEIVASHVERTSAFAALFSLPFGIRAATRVGPHEISAGDRVLLRWTAPRFADLRGAHQLRIESGNEQGLPGAALQTSNGVDGVGVARNVLEPTIDDFFNNRFGPMAPTAAVPVSRIDVSGYGASAVSRWTNPNAAVVDVTRVQFDVLVGRTAHEVVQVQALLWPSQAVVVRSVTMHRRGHGRVVRRDSGWQAATPGLFRHPLSQCEFHTGVVQGYYGIREIRDTSQHVTVRDPVTQAVAELVAVYFDCDVAVEGAVRGHREAVVDGQSLRLVPSQRQLGFVQVWPDGAPPPGPLTPGQLAALFVQQGAVGGAIDCEIDIGGSGQRMRLAGVRANVAPTPAGSTQFAVEAGGSLRLPGAGQWSAVRVRRPLTSVDSPEVEPLDPHRGLPLVRLNGMGASYRFADPRDLLSGGDPEMEYGILFASPAHRLLFRQPRIEPGAQAMTSLAAPLLADSYGMAASRGLFPRYHDAIPLPSSSYALDVVGEGELRLLPSPLEFAYTGVREISNSASMRLYVEYDATPFRLTFDSTAQDVTWSYDCGRPAVVAEDGKLGRVASALTLQEGRDKTGLMSMEPELKLGVSLDSASKLITVLRKLGFPVRVRVHQSHDDLVIEAKVSTERDVKPRPGSPPNFKKRIDLGIGKYSGEIKLEIRCGASSGKSGLKLEVKGELQQETPIPKVYAGGFIEVKLKFERDHRKKESESEISLAAGCVGSVGGALIPELLEAEVTARRGYIFQVQPDAPEPANRVNLGLIMGLEVRAALKAPVIGDVVRIEFEWEGRALIQRLEFNGVLESEVWIRAIVKAAVSVGFLFLDGEFELETEYQEHVPMVAVAGLAAAIGVGLIPPP